MLDTLAAGARVLRVRGVGGVESSSSRLAGARVAVLVWDRVWGPVEPEEIAPCWDCIPRCPLVTSGVGPPASGAPTGSLDDIIRGLVVSLD